MRPHGDSVALLCILIQGPFWWSFMLRRTLGPRGTADAGTPRNAQARAAPGAWALLTIYAAAMGLLFFGVWLTVLGWFPLAWVGWIQRGIGALPIFAATALTFWTLIVFRSWRLSAELDV